ncbi:hypothetical protein IPM19_03685 [bacterium]|nr:MAG: hypothetical protein IPM19_03685 [bacterium]
MNSGQKQYADNMVRHNFDELVPFYTVTYEEIITDPSDCNHKPSDIDISSHLTGAFGAFENETAAAKIIEFCRERDNTWDPFTFEQIHSYFKSKAGTIKDNTYYFSFWGLLLGEYIATDDVGNYYVTKGFVARCIESVEGRKANRRITGNCRFNSATVLAL